jgi:Tfp pilus assembly protein FimT
MATWIIVLLLLFIAVMLYLGVASLARMEQGITALSAKTQEYISDLQRDRSEARRQRIAESDGMSEWEREKRRE